MVTDMEYRELLCERILLMVKISPVGFIGDNEILSLILGEQVEEVSSVLLEMVETGLVFRWFDKDSSTRVLSLYSPEEEEKFTSKEKKERSKERKEIYTYLSSYYLRNKSLLRKLLFLHNTQKTGIKGFCKSSELAQEEEFAEEETVLTPAPKKEKMIVPGTITSIVNFWNNLGLKTCYIKDTEVFRKTWKKINDAKRGTLFSNDTRLQNRRFSSEEITESIKNFSLATLDSHYFPVPNSPLKNIYLKTTLESFLYNPFAKSVEGLSYLLKFQEKPRLLETSIPLLEDKYPKITKIYQSFYSNKALGGTLKEDKISPKEKNKFIDGANKTVDFFKENRNRFLNYSVMGGVNTEKMARWVCESIENDIEDGRVSLSPGFFCSDYTFSRRLPAYLVKQGIWE